MMDRGRILFGIDNRKSLLQFVFSQVYNIVLYFNSLYIEVYVGTSSKCIINHVICVYITHIYILNIYI